MKRIIQPDYYEAFHCIGGDCPFTCCQEWKISVDASTKKKWHHVNAPDANAYICLSDFIEKKDDTDVIRLLPNMRCPFLEDSDLCRLVLDHGEEMLSETCHIFPREEHVYQDHTEKSLVACCPVVVDFWKDRKQISFDGDVDPLNPLHFLKEAKGETMLLLIRDLVMNILYDERYTTEEALLSAFYTLLDIGDSFPSVALKGKDFLQYMSMEYSDRLYAAISSMEKSPLESLKERNELFLDMTENYRQEGRYKKLLEPLCEVAEKLEDLLEEEKSREIHRIKVLMEALAEAKKQQDDFFRNYLVAEIFTSLHIPGSNLYDLLMQFEWLMMEYAILMQSIFLDLYHSGVFPPYERIRELLVLIARMTGYDEADIEEYLENSFESPIWPLGYAQFLLS